MEYFKTYLPLIENTLNGMIPEKACHYQSLFEASRYSLLGGGKRLRPLLTIATVKIFGGQIETALAPASILEMVHTYSLIHDDLPSMDNDDYRRGKPSLHKAYSESLAILTGDYLLTRAFELLSQDSKLSLEQRIKLIQILGDAGNKMIQGQVMDLEFAQQKTDLKTLEEIHRFKTGAMMTASVLFGGVIANVSEKDLKILEKFGNHIGLSFQILDDILDVTDPSHKHISVSASDIRNQKSTYPSLLGLQDAKKKGKYHAQQALECLDEIKQDAAPLKEVVNFILSRLTAKSL